MLKTPEAWAGGDPENQVGTWMRMSDSGVCGWFSLLAHLEGAPSYRGLQRKQRPIIGSGAQARPAVLTVAALAAVVSFPSLQYTSGSHPERCR